ncbi:MAG: response regulator [Myxococcota bacterium]|nr:response regulator [Myxococcota bacterium]
MVPAAASAPSVLLVDDTPANLVALDAVLQPLQVRLVEARSGMEAIRCVAAETFAVVLLDVQMPILDGFETATRIRALPNGRDVPIIFLTAILRDEEYAKRGYASGAADFIAKPFDVDVLRARVKAFVDLFRQREEAHRTRFEARTRELDEAQRRLAAFERISTAALETDHLEPFLHTLLTVFLGAADTADTASVLLRRGDELHACASIGLSEDVETQLKIPVGVGFAGKIASTGRPLFMAEEDLQQIEQSPALRRRHVRALYGVPLVHDGDVIGVAHIGSTTATTFSDAEKRLFGAMADRAAWVVSRRRARERLYEVLHSAPALISVWRGPHYTCEFANAAYRRQFDAGDGISEEHGRRPWITPPMRELFDRVLKNGENVAVDEYVTTEGSSRGLEDQRFLALSLHPLRNASGEPEAVLAFAVDLTAQVRARRALEKSERERAHLLELERAARKEAEVASRAKDEFLATASHELRTPLNAILGWTASARRGVVKDLDRTLTIIERNARAQARIIDDVLDFARIGSGKLRLDIVPVEIGHALSGAVEAVRPAADAKGVALQSAVDPNLGIVGADVDRIQQIVWNLLSNAVKFTASGGRVELVAERTDTTIVIRVTDTGQGIAPDFLPHVFEPFRQADGSTTRHHGGLGLGLAIVKQLVHAHGGTIRAESAGLEKGASFTVVLPARVLALFGPASADDSGPVTIEPPAARLDRLRILVVDDDEDSRSLVREVLASQGATIELARSAEEALQKVKIFKPHVLVTDIGMPKHDGYALLRNVRALPAELGGTIPAIALTAYARDEDKDRAAMAGFEMHISKPVDPSQLVTFVAELASRALATSP